MAYEKESPMGTVYYISGTRLNLMRLRNQINEIDSRMEKTREDIRQLEQANALLGQIQQVLQCMHQCALRAAQPDCPDRPELERELSTLKTDLDELLGQVGKGEFTAGGA